MVYEKNNKQGWLSKKGAWAFSKFNRRLNKKEGVVFFRRVIPQCWWWLPYSIKMHAWGGVFPNLGRDDTCVIYTRQFFSAGNLLSSETSIIRLYGTHFYLHRAVATLRITDCLDVLCLFCFRTCFLLFLALVTQSYLGPSASLLLMSIHVHLLVGRALWSRDFCLMGHIS